MMASSSQMMSAKNHYFVKGSDKVGVLVRFREKPGLASELIAHEPLVYSLVKVLLCNFCSHRVGLEHRTFGKLSQKCFSKNTSASMRNDALSNNLQKFFMKIQSEPDGRFWSLSCILTSETSNKSHLALSGQADQRLHHPSPTSFDLEENHNLKHQLRRLCEAETQLTCLLHTLRLVLLKELPHWSEENLWDAATPLKNLRSLKQILHEAKDELSL